MSPSDQYAILLHSKLSSSDGSENFRHIHILSRSLLQFRAEQILTVAAEGCETRENTFSMISVSSDQ